MNPVHDRSFSARLLLLAAAVWLVSVTLCSTRVVTAPADHDHGTAHASPTHAAADHSHHSGQSDDHCGCQSFNAFPAQTLASLKAPAPVPASLLFVLTWSDEFSRKLDNLVTRTQATGPPARLSPQDQIRRHSRSNHAPPLVV